MGPAAEIDCLPAGLAIAALAVISTVSGVKRAASETSLMSRAPIFLPRYSGVRPTIRPPMKTDEQDEDEHRVEPGADAAEHHLAHREVRERHGSAEAR